MKNLLLNLAGWRERLAHESLAMFLDYDGTLSSIAPTPAEAKLPFATQEILKALIRYKNVKVAIISGRELKDLRRMVPVRGLTFVGSHGIELRSRGFAPCHVPKKYLKKLSELQCRLKKEFYGVSGVLFEKKPFSLAIHYRKASLRDERKIKSTAFDVCHDAVYQGQISILSGKKVIEIMPSTVMDKGQAVEKLLRFWGKGKFLPIFIGDDRTDEAAFEALRGRGLTVKVGDPDVRSGAEYYLNSVGDVRRLLRMILYFRSF